MTTLARWNSLPEAEAVDELLICCGSLAWAQRMARSRPYPSTERLFVVADQMWLDLPPKDWKEAFRCHPRIGSAVSAGATVHSLALSRQEQSQVLSSDEETLQQLIERNEQYESLYGFTFIVCATGKSAAEMLKILTDRLGRNPATEIREAAEQQRQITRLRLRRWLAE